MNTTYKFINNNIIQSSILSKITWRVTAVCYGALRRYVTAVRYVALRCVTLMRYGGVLRQCVTAVRYGALRCVTLRYGALRWCVTLVRCDGALRGYVTVCYVDALRCVTLVCYGSVLWCITEVC